MHQNYFIVGGERGSGVTGLGLGNESGTDDGIEAVGGPLGEFAACGGIDEGDGA